MRDPVAARRAPDRTLLAQHYLDGVSTEELAALYRVHRATVFRWITRARHRLLSRTRRAVADRLARGRSELDSVMRLVDSQLDVSLARLLAAAAAPPGSARPFPAACYAAGSEVPSTPRSTP